MVKTIGRPAFVDSPFQGLNVAVIGCGYWGPNLIRNFFEGRSSTVATVCDLDEGRLAPIAKRYPTVDLTTDYQAVLRDPKVDAVAIATSVTTHYHLARAALEAGKHVWIEKPITCDSSDAERLAELAEQKHLTLMVDHTFVYTSAVQRIRQAVDSGELGELLYYDSVRVNLGIYQHDVNVLWDLGIHDLAVMDYLLAQQPVAVSATGARHIGSGTESIAYVTVYFRDNLIAHFHVNWLAPVKVRLTTLCGSRSMIVYDDNLLLDKVRIYDRGVMVSEGTEDRKRLSVEYRSGDMRAPKLEQTEALQVATAHFTECVMTGKRPLTDASAGLRTVRLAEAAQRSMAAGGQVETVRW